MKDGSKKAAAKSKSVEKKPIVVNSLKDPKLKAYNDSLGLYNKGEQEFNKYKSFIKNNNIPIKSTRFWNEPVKYTEEKRDKIQPIQGRGFLYNHSPDVISNTNIPSDKINPHTFRYKKPNELVVYKKTEPVSPKSVEKKPKALQEVRITAKPKAPDSTDVGYAGKYTKFADKDIKEMVKKKQITSVDTSSKSKMSSTSYGSTDKAELMSSLLKKNKANKK